MKDSFLKTLFLLFDLSRTHKEVPNAGNVDLQNNDFMGDDFFQRVYEVVKLIPAGRVTSYGAIARYLGTTRSARMVGWAMNQSHSQREIIPAHRVVNRNGLLTGKHFFGGEKVMQELLESEGILIEDDQILDFKERFWDPTTELGY